MADDERTHCICGFTHTTRLMICCDDCNVWLHAECYGLDQKKVKEIEKKNLDFFCNECQPRTDLDLERAQAIQRREAARQEEKKEKRRRRHPASESSESSEEDEETEGSERRFSREDRKAMEYEKLFDKLKKDETKRRRKERPENELKGTSDVEDEENEITDEEDETLKAGRGRGRRGRPPKGAAKTKEPKELATRRTAKDVDSLPTTRKKPGRRPGRRPARAQKTAEVETPVQPEPIPETEEPETESADSGLEDEEPIIMSRFIEIPVRGNRSRKRKTLDYSLFTSVGEFGKNKPQSDHILAWRNGNNSKTVVRPETFSRRTESHGAHYRKQWCSKHFEATKNVPLVEDIVKQELRKRNIDLSTLEGLNNSANSDKNGSLMETQSQGDETSSQDSESSEKPVAPPVDKSNPMSSAEAQDNDGKKKLSLSDYVKRQREKNAKIAEERAKEEAERKRQENNRLNPDAVSAVLHSAVDAASKGSRVATVTPEDLDWLARLGINLQAENSQDLHQVATQLAKDTEQVLNIFRAANILASLTARRRLSRRANTFEDF